MNVKERIRHSVAHLLAEAVVERFGGDGPVLLAGGPPIEDGFYYDFGLPRPLGDDDLVWLEARLKDLIRPDVPFAREVVSEAEARQLFAAQPYKLETLEGLTGELTVYRHGGFQDLCEGPHVGRSSEIDPDGVKLLSVAGAYWRGDERRPMLTRVYGTAWESAAELAAYLERRAEAERRDHRRLGKELQLFFFHPTAPGMPYWLPKGLTILNELLSFWRREHARQGYQEIASPLINDKKLWVQSGHWDHYHDDMFVMEQGDGSVLGIKPMNCPNAMLVFNHQQRSYRDLPLRLSDCDILHRNERRGALHGLLRVAKFQQDDAHIFCAPEQIGGELDGILALVDRFYRLFDLDYSFRLATRPEKFLGEKATWDAAEAALRAVLDRHAGPGRYDVLEGDGAFYGPKIDLLVRDALGRTWQLGTIQLDFQLPDRFQCRYVDRDGQKRAPVVLHRVIYGSLERFIGVLLEHTGGALPLWLAPVQGQVLPVDERCEDYARAVASELREAGMRVEVSVDDTLNSRIRAATGQKIPYVLVVGERERQAGEVALRRHGNRVSQSLGRVALVELFSKENKPLKIS